MDAGLIVGACALGLAGLPHCAAMCAAPCAAACVGAPSEAAVRQMSFQVARMAGYAASGALAAASVGALASLSQWSPALRPLWALFHALLLVLGVWLVWQGRQPAWMGRLGRRAEAVAVPALPTGWQRVQGPVRAGAAGALWVAWPCGLLQSALLVASLANSPATGAAAMAGFALCSSAGLVAGPWLWARVRGGGQIATAERNLVRLAGSLLVLGSGFALVSGVWHQVAAFCGWA
jgi:sulfite exporter TauE/SafE